MRFTFTRHCNCADRSIPRIAGVRECTHCHGPVTLDHLELANGTSAYKYRCGWCKASSGALPKHLWPAASEPTRSNVGTNPPCEVFACRNPATEQHHWAPQYLFGREAWYWPTSYLCKEHHAEWHQKVTPQMASSSVTRSTTHRNGLPPGASTR